MNSVAAVLMGSVDMVDVQSRDCWADLDDLTVTRVQRLLSSSEQMNKMTDEQCYSRVDVMTEIACVCWHEYGNTSILYCKSNLVLLLRLGYLKPFLAGSKKTRQGPGWRVGALYISRCWFCLTVVAGPKWLKILQIYMVWCSFVLYGVLLCYGYW